MALSVAHLSAERTNGRKVSVGKGLPRGDPHTDPERRVHPFPGAGAETLRPRTLPACGAPHPLHDWWLLRACSQSAVGQKACLARPLWFLGPAHTVEHLTAWGGRARHRVHSPEQAG